MSATKVRNTIAGGVVHSVPEDLLAALMGDDTALEYWEDITPLARNEWLCWLEDAKKADTRQRRMDRLRSDLKSGKRRPCCWPGCCHRKRTGRP